MFALQTQVCRPSTTYGPLNTSRNDPDHKSKINSKLSSGVSSKQNRTMRTTKTWEQRDTMHFPYKKMQP